MSQEILWILALAAVVATALAAIALPIMKSRRSWDVEERTDLDRLFEEKGRVLRTLKDLDHEHAAGLLTQADWQAAREEQVGEAVKLNRAIAAATGLDPAKVPAESRP